MKHVPPGGCSRPPNPPPPGKVPKLEIKLQKPYQTKQHQWKTISIEDDLNGRRPQWKTISMENDIKEALQEADDFRLPS